MFSWLGKLNDFINDTKESPPPDPPETKDDGNQTDYLTDYFTTHLLRSRSSTQYVIDNALQVDPASFQKVDSASDQVDNQQPGKGSFRIGRQVIPDKLFAWYVSQSFIGYQACAFVAQHWLVDRACSLKGRDAVRKGFTLVFDEGHEVDPEIIEKIEKLDKKHCLKKMLEQADKFKNVYGIYFVLFHVNSTDPEYYEKPFNPDGIEPGSYRGMSGIDPYWVSPFLSSDSAYDPDSMDFYEPTFWYVSGQKIHKTHFVILRGPEVSDILKPSYLYGGIPLTQRILERVYAAERTANEAPQLAMTKRLVVRYIDDLKKFLAHPEKFDESMVALAEFRDNYGVFLDSAKNRVEHLDTSLTDLDAVIMTQYQIVASICGINSTKLLGTSPKGFQSTGEHEISSYHEELESIQENDLTPVVNKHHICLMYSLIAPTLPEGQALTVDITWNPLAVMSDKEKAEVAEIRARTDLLEKDTGSIGPYEIRDRLIADEISGYSGIERLDRPDDFQILDDPDDDEPSPESLGLTDELHKGDK